MNTSSGYVIYREQGQQPQILLAKSPISLFFFICVRNFNEKTTKGSEMLKTALSLVQKGVQCGKGKALVLQF